MAEEIDYRTLSESQLRVELQKLERSILRITGDPWSNSNQKFFRWSSNKNAVERVGEMMMDRSFILNLLFEKHCTPAEVSRMERVNDLLREMTERTYKRTAALARNVLSVPGEELDDDLVVRGKLVPEFDMASSVLRLEDDDFYGSDFIRMAAILQETEEYQPGMADVNCYVNQIENYHPGMSDDELGCSNTLDTDIENWAEAWLSIEPLQHIKYCYATHALVTHMNWSIPDLLRINNFKIEVTLTVQQYSDQERNRLWWWKKYGLEEFKQVLLKEAESRPEGIPLNTFILERTRDYFEDYADKTLAAVGIADIDAYLNALYEKI